ncbi:MAG: PadR family transcriptional regulator [Acidimicrobiia bacterium]
MTDNNRHDPSKFVPLPPAALHIVLALNRGERHGYAIMSDVERLSDGVIKMGPGTLYGTIKKLLAQGIIEQCESRSDTELDDQRRKYYRLTGLGEAVSAAEIQRLANLVERTRRTAPPRILGELA